MEALLLLAVLVLIPMLSLWFAADRTDARTEEARPENGWWPATIKAPSA